MKCPSCEETEELIEIGPDWCNECGVETVRYMCDECMKEFLACGHFPAEKRVCQSTASKFKREHSI
jgi:transposase-like protein